jgi:Fe-S-cluster-containing dehydrogenase component
MSHTGHGLFVLDLDRCTGCEACVVACNTENSVSDELSWRRIHTYNSQRLATSPVFHFTLACNHCLEPACMHNCPANAYTKDPSTGAVLIDQELCMGCRYCSWVCPYEAPQFNADSGVMEKCT